MSEITTKEAYDKLEREINADHAYAWSWHCNLACPIMDSGVDHETANKAAARLMRHLFRADPDVYTPRVT